MTEYRWRPTNAPLASSRTDDIFFVDARLGWAVNSNGHILRTDDGGATWEQQYSANGVYLRSIGFANERVGWVGTLDAEGPLLQTQDGGATWTRVEGLPPQTPPGICGLHVLDEQTIHGSGSNFTDRPTGMISSTDGGATWTGVDMSEHATMLIDVHFADALRGWAVGGRAEVADPQREDCRPVVLATEDGGLTWRDQLEGLGLAAGEWGWKIDFPGGGDVGYVSMENFTDAAILKTADGGRTWERKPVDDPQDNANLEGIGFFDADLGWTGGWGDENFEGGFTSETRDGGETWTDANHVGRFLNRFRFVRGPEVVGYAAGDTVYKYSTEPIDPSLAGPAAAPEIVRTQLPLRVPVAAEAGGAPARVDVWDRFGRRVATPLDEAEPAAGLEAEWDGETRAGGRARPGLYIVRVTVGDRAESRTVVIEG